MDIDTVIRYLQDTERQLRYYEQQYNEVYHDLGLLGEALGHPRVASPLSPAVLMRQYIEEVRTLRCNAPVA